MIRMILVSFLLLPLILPASDTPDLQLATVYRPGVDVSEYWISEKLDGVRGHWTGTELLTRSGNRINAPDWFTENWPAMKMDGELWIARGRFDELSGIARKLAPDDDEWRRIRFMVFDLPGHEGTFTDRIIVMSKLARVPGIEWLKPVEQFRVEDADTLDVLLDEIVSSGGEGLMLHHQDARYRAGRSGNLLKYKPYEDAEARVIAHVPGKGKYRGMVGALLVERDDGKRFRIGSGLSDADRANPPAPGSWVTYRYNGFTSNGLPRFARFVRVRDDMPPPDPG